jgi:S-layer homology domain
MTRKIKALVLALTVCALMILVGGVATAYPGSSGMGSGMMWGSTTTSSTQGATPPAPSPGWCWDNNSYRWVPPTTTTRTGSPSAPPTDRAGHFSDIPMGCWYDAAVTGLAGRGVIGGFADGTFRGDLSISRAQFAAMLGRMLGVQPGGRAQFSDVTDTWAEGWIAALAQGGIMQGYPDGTFGPNRQITRAQCAAFVARALGLPDDWTDTVQFRDLAGNWACGYVHQLWRQGIVSGYANGMFGPDDQISRAQAAAMLWRCSSLPAFAAR